MHSLCLPSNKCNHTPSNKYVVRNAYRQKQITMNLIEETFAGNHSMNTSHQKGNNECYSHAMVFKEI